MEVSCEPKDHPNHFLPSASPESSLNLGGRLPILMALSKEAHGATGTTVYTRDYDQHYLDEPGQGEEGSLAEAPHAQGPASLLAPYHEERETFQDQQESPIGALVDDYLDRRVREHNEPFEDENGNVVAPEPITSDMINFARVIAAKVASLSDEDVLVLARSIGNDPDLNAPLDESLLQALREHSGGAYPLTELYRDSLELGRVIASRGEGRGYDPEDYAMWSVRGDLAARLLRGTYLSQGLAVGHEEARDTEVSLRQGIDLVNRVTMDVSRALSLQSQHNKQIGQE